MVINWEEWVVTCKNSVLLVKSQIKENIACVYMCVSGNKDLQCTDWTVKFFESDHLI